jgi:hypothetical protein
MRRTTAWLGAALLAGAAPLAAQEVSLLLGGTHARYADTLSGSAGVTAARFRAVGQLRAIEVQGGVSQFASGEWAVQTSAQVASFVPMSGRVAVGIAAGGTGSNYEGGHWSGMAATGPLVVVSAGNTLLSAGVSGGGVRSVDLVNRAVGTGSLRVRHRPAPEVALDAGLLGTVATDAIRYADLIGGITLEQRTLLLAASAGVRAGELADGPWGQVRLEVAPTAFTRFEASAGRYPRDLSGFSDGFFVQVGIRLAVGSASPARAPAEPPVRTVRLGSTATRVYVRYERPVSRLAIAGAFSDWQPVPLERTGGCEWIVDLALPPGVHHFALIADGEWTLPDGLDAVDDGFGGRVGILVVQP